MNAMDRPRWTTGDRRTDAFVVLLVIAGSVTSALDWGVGLCLRHALWPASRLAEMSDRRSVWDYLMWLAYGPWTVVPVLIGLGGLLRLWSVRAAVIGAAAYVTLAALVASTEFLLLPCGWLGRGRAVPLFLWADALDMVVSALTTCLVPLAVFLVVLALRSPASERPGQLGARLTRLFLVAQGVALGTWGASGVLAGLASTFDSTLVYATAIYELEMALGAVNVLWGIALVVCSRRVTAAERLSRWLVWIAAAILLLGWMIGSALEIAWIHASLVACRLPYAWSVILAPLPIKYAGPVAGAGVMLWYWWPVLRGRVSPALDPDVPHCARCGYNLTGNVSGVCPECGTPVALAVSAGS